MPSIRNFQETLTMQYPLTYRAEYDTNNFVIYEGWSLKKSANTAAAEWLICKHTYSSNNLTQTDWASMEYNQIYDNRAALTYT